MAFSSEALIPLLQQSPLFSHLDPALTGRLAAFFRPYSVPAGQVMFRSGDPSESLYLVAEGQVRLERDTDPDSPVFARLSRGDYFGEEALWVDDPRFYRAVAVDEGVVYCLDVQDFLQMLEWLPGMEDLLAVSVRSRRLTLRQQPDWLGDDEFVHVISRRHPAILAGRLAIPMAAGVALGLLSLLLLWFWAPGSAYGWLTLGIGLPLAFGYALWGYFDWRNDYFLLTNKRVVWIEKVALVYDSRQEAPLRTIMSVGLQKTRLGNLLGYADVVVQTYVGTLRLGDLAYAETIANLIETYWHRTDNRNRREEGDQMARLLRRKLDRSANTATLGSSQPLTPTQSRPAASAPQEPGFWTWLLGDFIRLRYEQDGAITYRKHWFVLVRAIWLPTLLAVLALLAMVARVGGWLSFLPINGVLIGLSLFLFAVFLWFLYQYADWRNDIFQVTLDQIIDFDRKPLGKMRRRSAPLENVLSIEYQRRGFWGYLFNFGTVYISVGNSVLTFDFVYHPSEVQRDIFYRMGERLDEIRQFEIESERDRISEWIATYHRQTNRSATDETAPDDI